MATVKGKKRRYAKRILIAYDGSGYAHGVLSELLLSGLPNEAEVMIVTVSEIWLSLGVQTAEECLDKDIAEYFLKHREQAERNLKEARVIVRQARAELLRYFPDWNI